MYDVVGLVVQSGETVILLHEVEVKAMKKDLKDDDKSHKRTVECGSRVCE